MTNTNPWTDRVIHFHFEFSLKTGKVKKEEKKKVAAKRLQTPARKWRMGLK